MPHLHVVSYTQTHRHNRQNKGVQIFTICTFVQIKVNRYISMSHRHIYNYWKPLRVKYCQDDIHRRYHEAHRAFGYPSNLTEMKFKQKNLNKIKINKTNIKILINRDR